MPFAAARTRRCQSRKAGDSTQENLAVRFRLPFRILLSNCCCLSFIASCLSVRIFINHPCPQHVGWYSVKCVWGSSLEACDHSWIRWPGAAQTSVLRTRPFSLDRFLLPVDTDAEELAREGGSERSFQGVYEDRPEIDPFRTKNVD